jgi:hypothetical protein
MEEKKIEIEFTHTELRVLINNSRMGIFNSDEDAAIYLETMNKIKSAERQTR